MEIKTTRRNSQLPFEDEEVEKRESLCTVDGNVNWCNHMENSRECPQEIKNRTAI